MSDNEQGYKWALIIVLVILFYVVYLVVSGKQADAAEIQPRQQLPEIHYLTPVEMLDTYGQHPFELSQWEIDRLKLIMYRESTYKPWVRNGQYCGLFQMGRNEWATYGNGGDCTNGIDNIFAALRYYQVSGFRPWAATDY